MNIYDSLIKNEGVIGHIPGKYYSLAKLTNQFVEEDRFNVKKESLEEAKKYLYYEACFDEIINLSIYAGVLGFAYVIS